MKNNPLLSAISAWFQRIFADPSAISLFFFIVLVIVVLEYFGTVAEPIVISLVLAYLLNSPVRWLQRMKFPHILSVLIVFLLFLGIVVTIFVFLMPLLWKQVNHLIAEIPAIINMVQSWLSQLKVRFPHQFNDAQIQHIIMLIREQAGNLGKWAFSFSLSTIPSILGIIVYLILVPVVVFFLMKDRDLLMRNSSEYLPSNRSLINKVWHDIDRSITGYVKGRVLEIFIILAISLVALTLLNFTYALTLAVLMGLSVIIPYLGIILVTIPAVILGLMQWGLHIHFVYYIITFTVIMLLDGNVLAPLLFAGTMDLHPVILIISVLLFGYIWGFWGVFLANPLAALVKSIIKEWPKSLDTT